LNPKIQIRTSTLSSLNLKPETGEGRKKLFPPSPVPLPDTQTFGDANISNQKSEY